jgi:hypothetical protein
MKGERNFSQSALTDYSQMFNNTLDEEDSDIEVETDIPDAL